MSAEARPITAADQPSTAGASRHRRVPVFAMAFGGLLALGLGAAWMIFGSLPVALRYLRGERLIAEPTRIHLNHLSAEVPTEALVEVRNYNLRAVQLLGATTQCTCVFARDLPVTIPAGRRFRLPIQVRLLPGKPTVDV
jgi:hypothetical protein